VHGVQAANTSMVELMIDLDTLLATSAGFLLGQWISDARKLATSAGHPEDQDFLQRVHVFADFPAMLPYFCILARSLVYLALAQIDAIRLCLFLFSDGFFDTCLPAMHPENNTKLGEKSSSDGFVVSLSSYQWYTRF
jgi:hypothetical protein